MKKFILVAGSTLYLSGFAFAQGQSANPTQPGSSVSTPIPGSVQSQTLRPDRPNASEAALDSSITPLTPLPTGVEDPSAQSQSVTSAAVADGKTLAGPTRTDYKFSPIFGAGVVYDDNIFITNTNRVADVIWSVSAGLAFQLGDFRNLKDNYLIAQWVGSGFFFTNNPSQNSFNQNASLVGQYRWNQLVTQVESRYQDLTGPDRQVGSFTTRTMITNVLRAIYEFSDKTTLDAEFGQISQLFKEYLNQYTYYAKGGVDYLILPKVKLGFEGTGGILDIESSNTQVYEQVRARVKYSLTGKIDLKASGGVEFRQFSGGEDMRITPVFSLGAEYRPFANTTFGILGYREAFGSSLATNQNYVATGVQITAQQVLFQKFAVGAAFGYENDTYYATASDSPTDRVDNFIFIRPSIAYTFVEWMTASVFYEFRNNASNETSNTFYDNRVGMDLGLRF